MGSPSTVLGVITKIDINPIQCHSFWPITHIFVEIFKYFPFVTYIYSSAAIMLKLWSIRIGASIKHANP